MSGGKASSKCFECGCICHNCSDSRDLDYHHQIEELQRRIRDQRQSYARLEADLAAERDSRRSDSERQTEDLARLRDRYDRLLESHKRLSRVNAGLEEKLLDLAGRFDSEQRTLLDRLAGAETKLAEADDTVERLRAERERCKAECEIAVQMLRSRPEAFAPDEAERADWFDDSGSGGRSLQVKPPTTSSYVTVPLPTFPPTFAHFPRQQQQPPQPQPMLHRAASVGDARALAAASAADAPQSRSHSGASTPGVSIRRGIFDV